MRTLMEERGMSARRLAQQVGCHHSYISLILAGRRFPRPDILDRMADALGVPSHQLYRLLRDAQQKAG